MQSESLCVLISNYLSAHVGLWLCLWLVHIPSCVYVLLTGHWPINSPAWIMPGQTAQSAMPSMMIHLLQFPPDAWCVSLHVSSSPLAFLLWGPLGLHYGAGRKLLGWLTGDHQTHWTAACNVWHSKPPLIRVPARVTKVKMELFSFPSGILSPHCCKYRPNTSTQHKHHVQRRGDAITDHIRQRLLRVVAARLFYCC